MFFNVCKSFAFVAGLGSIHYIIMKHVSACARDELCTAGELQLLEHLLTCLNFISKQNGLVHLLYAMPVRSFVCKCLKRILVLVKLWITIIVFCMQIYETWLGNDLGCRVCSSDLM